MYILLKLHYAKFGFFNLCFFSYVFKVIDKKPFGGQLDYFGKGRVKSLMASSQL